MYKGFFRILLLLMFYWVTSCTNSKIYYFLKMLMQLRILLLQLGYLRLYSSNPLPIFVHEQTLTHHSIL
jgi:hypothetical protein